MFINTVLFICENHAQSSLNIHSGLSSSCFYNKRDNMIRSMKKKKGNQVNVVGNAIIHRVDINKTRTGGEKIKPCYNCYYYCYFQYTRRREVFFNVQNVFFRQRSILN